MTLDEIVRALAANKDKDAITSEAMKATAGLRWVPNPGPQTEAYFSPADEVFYGGQAGGGKVLTNQELICTPKGLVKACDIKVGDILSDPGTGGQTRVIGVFPQPIQPFYRFYFDDGTFVDSGGPHKWLYRPNKHRHPAPRSKASAQRNFAEKSLSSRPLFGAANIPWRVGTTDDIRAYLDAGTECRIPLTHPLVFTKYWRPWTVDVYLLGLLLGDGHCASRTVTNADKEIIDYCVASGGVRYDYEGKCPNIRFGLKAPTGKNLYQFLRKYGLLSCLAWEKFVPDSLKWGRIEDRLALLQGLLDSDGTVDDRGRVYFSSTSRKLAEDVAFMARSLGAKARLRERVTKFTHKEEKKAGRTSWTVRIWHEKLSSFFRLTRKKERCTDRWNGGAELTKAIVRYERIEDSDGVCLAVDSPYHIYLAGDALTVTHNTDLELGLALNCHHRSLVLRRTNKEAGGLVERLAAIVGNRDGWNSQGGIWRFPGGKTIELGGCQLEEDKQKYKGNPHDYISFDEVSDFTESQYLFITTWNRSAIPGQRCRILAGGNPPTRPEGLWVVKRWGAWLDPQHPNPAQPGELRWYTNGPDGKEIEVNGRGPHMINGEPVFARSRTFIPAKLTDNPDLAASGYDATLAALPEDLRAAYRDGIFTTALRDDAFQVIPTDWIRAAQARWTPQPPVGVPMCAIGVDPAQGGNCDTTLAPRHDGWFAPIIAIPGKKTPDGKSVAGAVVQYRRNDAAVIIDIGGGWGGDAYAHMRENGIPAISYMGVKESNQRTIDRTLKFSNVRTEAYWRFREALDPSQPQGSAIALPPDSTLVADLCAPKYKVTSNGIMITPKADLVKQLGRSPDRGDATVMSWWQGLKQINVQGGWQGQRDKRGHSSSADMGKHAQARAKWRGR